MPSLIFYTLFPPARAPHIRRVILCQAHSTLLSQKYVFPRLTHLLCGAFERGYKAATEALCASPMINISEVKPRFYERHL